MTTGKRIAIEKIKKKVASCGKKAKQKETFAHFSWEHKVMSHYGNNLEVPRMFENLITTELTNLLEYISEGNTNSILKRRLHLMLLQHSAQ